MNMCVYIYIHIYTYTKTQICIYSNLYVYKDIYIYTNIYAGQLALKLVQARGDGSRKSTGKQICVYIYICIYTYVCTQQSVYIPIYIYIQIFMYIYIFIYTYECRTFFTATRTSAWERRQHEHWQAQDRNDSARAHQSHH